MEQYKTTPLAQVVLALFLLPFAARSQQTSTAAHIRYGASLPSTCKPSTGDIFFKTTATIGGYQCLTANTWTAMGGAAPTAPTFADITSGTNTSAAMVVGTGASLAASGSGTIAATSVTGLSGLTTGTIPKAASSTSLANSILTESSGVLTAQNGSSTTNLTIVSDASSTSQTWKQSTFVVGGFSTNDGFWIGNSNARGFTLYADDGIKQGNIGARLIDNGGNGELRLNTTGLLFWSNSASAVTPDTGLSKVSAGVVGVGTGAQGSVAGTLSTTGLTAAGSAITLSGLGNATGTPSSLCQNTNTVVRNAALTCTVSSERVKNSFAPIPDTDFMAIRPMQFEYNDVPGRVRWGFGANQVASVNPALADGWRDDGEPWSLDQNAILALTVKTVQELRAELASLKAQLKKK